MWRYIVKRILMLIPVVIGASLLVFCVMNLSKGDVVSVITAGADMTNEQIEAVREAMGLNRPLLVRYGEYLFGMLRGDFGKSAISNEPVLKLFFTRFPATVKLAIASSIVNIVLSIPLGIFSARHQGSVADNAAMVFALMGLSMPAFWLGLMLMVLFCVNLQWLPATGGGTDFKSIILPAVTMGIGMMATTTRTTRSAMLDVLRQDYLRTARAKGVPEKKVINLHALKNAMIPILTTVGTQLAKAFGGGAVIEMVFAYPGVGKLLLDAINNRDTTLACGCIVLQTTITVVVLLIVDILYAFVDPRVKAQYAKGGKKK
ncbi:MAG: ABC transporter permease [Lachnospiraceae bacterium]|nr:ABC transporter permease [Lachnospiraceae bacterium]